MRHHNKRAWCVSPDEWRKSESSKHLWHGIIHADNFRSFEMARELSSNAVRRVATTVESELPSKTSHGFYGQHDEQSAYRTESAARILATDESRFEAEHGAAASSHPSHSDAATRKRRH